jgi:hypothetical protein
MKKILLSAALAVFCTGAFAQQKQGKTYTKVSISMEEEQKTAAQIQRRCGTPIPDKRWDNWMNQAAEQLKLAYPNGISSTTYTILDFPLKQPPQDRTIQPPHFELPFNLI